MKGFHSQQQPASSRDYPIECTLRPGLWLAFSAQGFVSRPVQSAITLPAPLEEVGVIGVDQQAAKASHIDVKDGALDAMVLLSVVLAIQEQSELF